MSDREISFGLSDSRLLLEQLRIAARSDGASPKSFALLLRRVFEDRAWKQEGFATFCAYVKADEPYGLGMTEERLLDAARLAGVEPLARSLLYEEAEPERPVGRPKSGEENSRVTGIRSVGASDNADWIVGRLKRDAAHDSQAAGLAAKVISGEVTANAAAREMGWRKPRIILSSPERIADSLRRYMPREALARLVELLTEKES